MAVSSIVLTALGTNLFQDTDSGNAAVAIKGATGTLYVIHVDNSANVAAASYIKLYDTAAVVVVGTTAPDFIIKVPGGFVGPVLIAPQGIVFASGLQVAGLTTGGTAGTTSPTGDVIVRVVYT